MEKMQEIRVTISKPDGEVLDKIIVLVPSNGKGTSAEVGANAIRDLIEHKFETEEV